MSATCRLLLIRHASTPWNEAGRIQGRCDMALSDAGRAALSGLRVPLPWGAGTWHTSPLARARQSASLLGADTPLIEPRLTEMDWGRWEGETLEALRGRLGPSMVANEARGLDFRPCGGESPREVRERLAQWLCGLPPDGPARVALTHKGVIRAALSLATGWDMRATFRPRPDWACGQAFLVGAGGTLSVDRLNVDLRVGAP